jgi:hypothetical protein
LHASSLYRIDDEIPNIVIIGLPNVAALKRALAKLKSNQIPHFAWSEPDFDYGLTALCTAPVAGEQRKALSNYRVYNHASVAQIGSTEHSIPNREAAGAEPARGSNFVTPVAQAASAPDSKSGDDGSTPSGCATTPSMEASVRV